LPGKLKQVTQVTFCWYA